MAAKSWLSMGNIGNGIKFLKLASCLQATLFFRNDPKDGRLC